MEYLSCLNPKVVRNPYTETLVTVPCGECSACRSLHASSWAKRLDLESSFHRFTYFLTLTYTDDHLPYRPVSDASTEDGYSKAVELSSDWITSHDGYIPCINIRDIQLFFKRIRKYISDDYEKGIYKEKPKLRYFCASEYGPTTFRPHYHMLLWFDSEALNKRIKDYIYKSWKHSNSCKTFSEFFERNRFMCVLYSASQYVAGYINCNTNLPAILTLPPFRSKHIQSNSPSIGFRGMEQAEIQKLFFGYSNTLSVVSSASGGVSVVPLWLSLESRLFPRCIGFRTFSYRERYSLFRAASAFGKVGSFREWYQLFQDAFDSYTPFVALVCRAIRTDDVQSKRAVESLKRIYYNSVRIRKTACAFGLQISDLLEHSTSYYHRKDYACLVRQLQYEEELSNSLEGFVYYPLLVDAQFGNNDRNLPPKTYELYLSQFGLTYNSLFDYGIKNSPPYLRSKSLYDKIVSDNTKTRRKKDYLSNHPEFEQYYTNLITYRL